MHHLPSVSVILAVRNEQAAIDECLTSLSSQDYQGSWEVIVADGASTDGTRSRLDAWSDRLPGLTVIDNPARLQSHGLNRAAGTAGGDVLVRTDAHSRYAPDYITRSVEVLSESGAVAVGGRLYPEGRSRFGRAVAAAMGSPLAIGPGKFHHADRPQPADTVYLGTFRRADFLEIGGYRAFPSGVAEDADLYFRWRRAGRLVYLDPAIRSIYHPRESPAALWCQFWRYGMGKADMLFVNGRWPSWRPLAPTALVLGLATTAVLGALTRRWAVFSVPGGAWLAAVGAEAARIAPGRASWSGALAAMVIMHLSYGSGVLRGLLRRPSHVRSRVVHVPPTDL